MCNIATFYIGYLRAVGDTSDFGDPNTRQETRRKIKIENLVGNIIELTLWDEMAKHFDQADIKNMEQKVIIAISSCRVSKYQDYQLFASLTTYYYLNPNIPEAAESRAVFKARYEDSPPLIISKLPYQDVQQEKTRNRFPLKTIMEQNPNNYKRLVLHLMPSMRHSSDNSEENYTCFRSRPTARPFLQIQVQRIHHRQHCNHLDHILHSSGGQSDRPSVCKAGRKTQADRSEEDTTRDLSSTRKN
ncbi:nucleic acid-binding, OB-fold protein [Tanacetum coccineum]|uniref:Nucleic acid-binding, OB-fold protein n=1 Tax=Tanacetum coccineum TaxID=301880 RepID=A0ABQ5AUJ4_9ASTR